MICMTAEDQDALVPVTAGEPARAWSEREIMGKRCVGHTKAEL